MSDDFDPVGFLEDAVAIPSHEDPGEMRDFLVGTLEDGGIEATVDAAGNTIATVGSGSPHVVLNTHIDTVPPHVPPEREGDVLHGRGACDAKGPLAAMLDAVMADPPTRVTLAVTPDEEVNSTGAAALDLDPDAFIVGEPTDLDVCAAARGRFEAVVSITGENAHAAEAWKGVNAVAAAGPVLEGIGSFDATAGPASHPMLGDPALTPTVIHGGETSNQVPDWCEITVDRRSVPPEEAEGFRTALEAHLRDIVPDRAGVSVALEDRETPFLEAWATDEDAAVVRAMAAASGGVVRPFTAATEAAYFADRAPTVVFGPGVLVDDEGPVAHADREYVRLPDVRAAGRAMRKGLQHLAGGD